MILYTLGRKCPSPSKGEGLPVLNGFFTCSENLAERWLAIGGIVTVQTSVGVDLDSVREIMRADLHETSDMVCDAEQSAGIGAL